MSDPQATNKVAPTTTNKTKKPFFLIRQWGFAEDNLTETEDRTLEALQKYRRAETDAEYMGELDATELLKIAMYEAKRGTLLSFCHDSELNTKDAKALARTFKVWRKWAKRHEKMVRKQAAKKEQG